MNAKIGLLALVLLTMLVCSAMAMQKGNVSSSVTVTGSPPEITVLYLDPDESVPFGTLPGRYTGRITFTPTAVE